MSYYRGRRGDRSWRGSSRSTPQQGPIVTPPAPPLGDLLSQVTPEECIEGERDSQMRIQITDTRLLASYNWVDAGGPSIVFPGMLSATTVDTLWLIERDRHATGMEPSVGHSEARGGHRQVFQRCKRRTPSGSSYGASGQSSDRSKPSP